MNRLHIGRLPAADWVSGPHQIGLDLGHQQPKRQHLPALGPDPKASLEAFVDLGLSDSEIARYFRVPQSSITALCRMWCIRA